MKSVNERMTVQRDDGIVVFLIGMRVNKWWKLHRWLPVARAMPRMLRELSSRPGSGLLGATFSLTADGPFMVQYWESTAKLLSYASDRGGEHFPAWTAFNRSIGTGGDVGIWHETYVVPRGAYEAIYVNMPPFGLGRFAELQPARGVRARAAGRLTAATESDAVRAPSAAAE